MQNYNYLDSPSFVYDSDDDEDNSNVYQGMQKIPNVPIPNYMVKPNNLFKRSKNETTGNSLKKYLIEIKHPLVTSTPLNDSFSSNFSLNLTPIKQKRNSLVTGHFVDDKQKLSTDAVKSRSNPIKDHSSKPKRKIKKVKKSSSQKKGELSEDYNLDGIEPLIEITNNSAQGKITKKLFIEQETQTSEFLSNTYTQVLLSKTDGPSDQKSAMNDVSKMRKSIEMILKDFDALTSPVEKISSHNFKKSNCEYQKSINDNMPNIRSKLEFSKTILQVPSGRVLRSASRLLSCTSDNTNARDTFETQSNNDTSTVNKKKVEPLDNSMARKKLEANETIDNTTCKRPRRRSNTQLNILDSIIENNVTTNTINKTGSTHQRKRQNAKPKKKHTKVQDTVREDLNEILQSFHDVPIIEENIEQNGKLNISSIPETLIASNSIKENETDLEATIKSRRTNYKKLNTRSNILQLTSDANKTIEPVGNKDVTLTKTRTRRKEKTDETLLNSTGTHEIAEEIGAIKDVSTAKSIVARKRKSKCLTNTLKEKKSMIETRSTKKKQLDAVITSSNSQSKPNQTTEETVNIFETETKVSNKRSRRKDKASENVLEVTQLEEVDSCVTGSTRRNTKTKKKEKAHEKIIVGRDKNNYNSESMEESRIDETKTVSLTLQQYIVNQNYSEKSSRSSSRTSSRSSNRSSKRRRPNIVEKTWNNNTTKVQNLEGEIGLEIFPEVVEDSTGANNNTHTITSNVSEFSTSADDKVFIKPKIIPQKKSKPKSKPSILKQSSLDTVLHSLLAVDGIDSVDNAGICDKNQTSTSNDCTLVNTMTAESVTDLARLNKSGDHVDEVDGVSATSRSQFKRITVHQDKIIPPTHGLDNNDIKKLCSDKNSNFNDDGTNESANTDQNRKSPKQMIQGLVNNKAVLLEWYSDDTHLEDCKNVNVVYSLTNLRSHMCTAACGYITLGPGQEKSQVPRKDNILFKVEKGRGLVTQQFVTKVMEVDRSFYIPLCSPYTIKNLSDTESLILYFVKMSET